MIVAIALSIMIFTTTCSVLVGLRSAPSAFAANEGFAISSSSAPTIFASSVDVSMVSALESIPNITGASPEIFAFSSWNGESFVLRGVILEKLNKTGPSFKEFELVPGDAGPSLTKAYVGSRLLDRLGIQLPFTMPVVGSYSMRLELLNVVGEFETGSSLDDEMLIGLEVARFLTGTPSNKVSIIRVSTSEPEWLSDVLSPSGARFTLFDLYTSKSQVAQSEVATVSVGVRNWGSAAGETGVTFTIDGVSNTTKVGLNSTQSDRVSLNYSSAELGPHTIEASIGGSFPVRLSANITIVHPYLQLAVQSKIILNGTLAIKVTDHRGTALYGASVTFGSATNATDGEGNVTFVAGQLGTFQAVANLSGYTDASANITVVDPASYAASFQPLVTSFSLSPSSVKQSESATGQVVVENNGTVGGSVNITVFLDNAGYVVLNVSLAGLESKTVVFKMRDLAVGTHSVQVATFSRELVVQSWVADNPDLVQLVMRYGGSGSLFSAGSVPIYQAAKISEGNVAVALFAIGGISALLAALAITAVFSKEIHEGRRRLGVLRTIGAPRSAIRKLVFPQALETSLAGAGIGIAFGVVIADTISKSDLLVLFGHRFQLDMDTSLLILILLGAMAISVASALASAMMAVRETAITSIRRLEEESGERLDVVELIGDD